MPKAQANGMEIEWEAIGDQGAPAVLLIMGLGAQMTLWPADLLTGLAARGLRAVRFDNRDVGLSSKMEQAGVPDLARLGMQLMTGARVEAPYTLDDMAADAVGLLDALGIASAHIVGASMGGMIAQLVASLHPERTLSLTSIMSTTGNPALPHATAEANAVLMTRPTGGDVESLVAHGLRAAKAIGSPGYPLDEAATMARIRADIARSFYPQGFARQMAAIIANGDRRPRLKTIIAPTLVIHGTDDPLVRVEGGRDTAATISGARLVEIPGMGHDLPPALIGRIVDLIADNALGSRAAT
jgi:pimeloyl-ACP methyl ester carboxylesterase